MYVLNFCVSNKNMISLKLERWLGAHTQLSCKLIYTCNTRALKGLRIYFSAKKASFGSDAWFIGGKRVSIPTCTIKRNRLHRTRPFLSPPHFVNLGAIVCVCATSVCMRVRTCVRKRVGGVVGDTFTNYHLTVRNNLERHDL